MQQGFVLTLSGKSCTRLLMPATPRTEKLDLRISPQAKQRIAAAAEEEGRTVSDFVLKSALDRAAETLADKRVWKLSAAQWEKFQAALDAPPQDNPALRKFLTEPSAVERSQTKT
jgi:uncharacterized protein (DUF1778 family)